MIYTVMFGGAKDTPFQVLDSKNRKVYYGSAGRVVFNNKADMEKAFIAAVRKGTPSYRAAYLGGGSLVDIDFPEDCVKRFKTYES